MTHAEQAAEVPPLSREAAEELADRICAYAARQARDSCELLILIGEFDAGRGWGWSQGFKSVAHWLAWTCSMTPATAREHIRVARALRRMPTVTAAFGAGELSYSKVREVTRVVDVVDETQLCELAKYATASQLARMISSYRAAAGTRIRAESRRLFRLVARDGDPMTGITGRLATEEAAIVTAALERARDLNSTPPATADRDLEPIDPDEHDATPPYTDAEAFLEVCRHYLATAVTDDESGEDRTLVIIEVAAEQLALAEVPAGATVREHPVIPGEVATVELDDVPAGTPQPSAFATGKADAGEFSTGTGVRPIIISPAVRDGDVPAGTRQPAATSCPMDDAGAVPAGRFGRSTTTSPLTRNGDLPAETRQPVGNISQLDEAGEISAGAERSSTTASPVARDGGGPAATGSWSMITSPDARNGGVPAGTSQPEGISSAITDAVDVPAGTPRAPVDRAAKSEFRHPPTPRPGDRESSLRAQVCTVRGAGPLEPQTAQRMICTGSVLGAIVDRHGDVLALGRTRRLVSKRQRCAVLIRDQVCQFPGCWRDRRLQAHHRVPWSHGGTTDLANLILLCGVHHTAVHEGGIAIVRRAGAAFLGARTGGSSWQFLLPDGQPVAETGWRVMPADRLFRELSAYQSGPNGHDHPDATSIRTIGGGEGFNLRNCVDALFSMTMDQDHAAA